MSQPELLDQAVAALRDQHDGDGSDLMDDTRWRIRDSLAERAAARGRLIAMLIILGVLGTGTASWAYLSGRLDSVWPWMVGSNDPASAPSKRRLVPSGPVHSGGGPPVPTVAAAVPVAPAADAPVEPAVVVAPALAASVAPAPRPARRLRSEQSVAASAEPTTAPPDLYRVAHQLHFHGDDPGAAVVAWDAYLASAAGGRFAIEARYNRAIALIRLRRYPEAIAALAPFARGEVAPTGYRQVEAQRLSARLQRALQPTSR
jgi:hypothetical protein